MTLLVPHRFRGPTTSGNGGYTAGVLAARLGADVGAVTVTLRLPPPLETPMVVQPVGDGLHDGVTLRDGVTLHHGDDLVAEATRATVTDLVTVPPVGPEQAAEASSTYAGLRRHPFPECFVCGTARGEDAMGLRPGRIDHGRTACVWTVAPDLAGRAELVWAALDCPGGWAAPIEGRPMVLGRITAEVPGTTRPGERCVVMGQLLATEGRKSFTATTLYGEDGRVVGRARSTWIAVPATAA
ncbi:hypothetical protein [Georgenia muralis]|uniref:Thioesterase superfamily protein n=1 Tax=Georgenia muralis TaxID=154117 RepID=A0A3N4Z523_9MICO|nr:hypothetical protein [Georgenia muralis]RPF28419.1 hypothetical protein EDD32_2946 [Georgenia muralis]